MSSAKIDSSTYFPIWISFIYFSSLIAMARISKSLLSNSDKSEHLSLVPDLRENVFSYSSSMMCAVGLSYYGLYYIKVCFLYIHFLERFYHKWVLDCFQVFSSTEMIMIFLFFSWCSKSHSLVCLCWTILVTMDEPKLVMVYYIFLCVLLDLIC